MANPEHLAKLKEGVEAWNAWRRENLGFVPDPNGTDLRGSCLREVDLREADLRTANLRGIDLREANLSEANLQLTMNLSVEQLSEVKTLSEAELDPDLMKQIQKNYPHLLAKPESGK